MGVLSLKKVFNQSELGLWKITESISELYQAAKLGEQDKIRFKEIKSEKRKKEWLTVKCLLQTIMLGKECIILYSTEGRPYLEGGVFLSVSHSKDYVCIALNLHNPVGVDIQVKKDIIEQGKQFFMRDDELSELGYFKVKDKLHIYWSAKEAVFKYFGKEEISFRDIYIDSFDLNDQNVLKAIVDKENAELALCYELEKEFVLVYTT